MNDEARRLLTAVLEEAHHILTPLDQTAAAEPEQLYHLCARFGWTLEGLREIDQVSVNLVRVALDDVHAKISTRVVAASEGADASATPDAVLAEAVARLGTDVYSALRLVGKHLADGADANLDAVIMDEFVRDLIQHLALEYLAERWPAALQVCLLLGVVVERRPAAIKAGGEGGAGKLLLRHPNKRLEFAWAALPGHAINPFAHLARFMEDGATPPTAAAPDTSAARMPLLDRSEAMLKALALLQIALDEAGLKDLKVEAKANSVEVSNIEAPLLPASSALLTASLPVLAAYAPVITVGTHSIKISWADAPPPVTDAKKLFEESGFELFVLEGKADGCEPGLQLAQQGGKVGLILTGGLGLKVPPAALTHAAGGHVTCAACARLTLTQGRLPILEITSVGITNAEFQVGGSAGAHLRGVEVRAENLIFPAAAKPDAQFQLVIGGELVLPSGSASVRVSGRFSRRAFDLETVADVTLGDSIKLHGLGGEPVLRLEAAAGARLSSRFRLRAGVDIPQGASTTRAEVSGELELEQAAGGVRVKNFVAASSREAEWLLPGSIRLKRSAVRLTYSEAAGFGLRIRGHLDFGDDVTMDFGTPDAAIDVGISVDRDDAQKVRFDGSATGLKFNIRDQARLFGGDLVLHAATKPTTGSLHLSRASLGLFLRSRTTPTAATTLADYALAVDRVGGAFTFDASGFELRCTSGTLRLPAVFASGAEVGGGGQPPTVEVREGAPLVLRYNAGASRPLSFAGTFVFSNFGVHVPGTGGGQDFRCALTSASLRLSSSDLPRLTEVSGGVRLPLPGNKVLAASFKSVEWNMDGLPTGVLQLDEDVPFTVAEIEFTFLGATAPRSEWRSRLSVTRPGGAASFTLTGGVRVALPATVVTGQGGDRVEATLGGTLELAAGRPPRLKDIAVAFAAPALHLGGAGGVLIQQASLTAAGVENLFNLSRATPLTLTLTGEIVLPHEGAAGQGPALALEEAKFTFFSDRELPAFDVRGLRVKTGEATMGGLPFKLREAGVHFIHDGPEWQAITQKLRPDNIELLLSAEAGLIIGDSMPSVSGRADGLKVTFNAQGLPNRVEVYGLGFGLSNVNFGIMSVDATIYLGGLNTPLDRFFAGKGGGVVYGAGVKVLLAFGRPDRIGLCLDASGGPSGIVLGQTGFMITGASGGVSLANTNADPCDITTYIRDGRPIDAPQTTPKPARETPAMDEPSSVPLPAAGGSSELKCPRAECPPPSVNILCQPHPTDASRTILKFSSLDEAKLRAIGITPAFVASLGPAPSADDIGRLSTELVRKIRGLVLTNFVRPPAEVRRRLEDAEAALGQYVARQISAQIGGGKTAYDAVRFVAALGLPCPDMTLQVSGTFSHLSVTAYLSLRGGVRVSTAGSAGGLGTLFLCGIPFGRASVFVTGTDERGDPATSLCGVVECSVGPLELGKVRVSYTCQGCVTGFAGSVAKFGRHLSGELIKEIVAKVAPAALKSNAYEPANPRTALDAMLSFPDRAPAWAAGFVAELHNRPPSPEIRECFVTLLRDTWANFNPEILLCGIVQPKLFGLPLAGKLVEVRAGVTKERLAMSVGFSPLSVLATFFVSTYFSPFFNVDKAALGMVVELPRLEEMVEMARGDLTGHARRPEDLTRFAEFGFNKLLTSAVLTAEYEIAPMGIELAGVEGRFIMPDFMRHPARSSAPWRPPEQRGDNWRSRWDVLVGALDDRLGNPLWKGTKEELAALPNPENKTTGGLSLLEYFPHGGFLGAGRLPMPRALTAAPDLELLTKIFGTAAPAQGGQTSTFDRLTAALTFATQYVLATEKMGALAFYVPAPNPPVFFENGRELTPRELTERMLAQKLDPSRLDSSPLYPFEQAFGRGYVEGKLLGIPIARADAVAMPLPGSKKPGGYTRVSAGIPPGSWLKHFVERADLVFEIRQPPPRSVKETFTALAARIRELIGNSARTEQAADNMLAQFKRSVAQDLPKVSLEAYLMKFRFPPVAKLDQLLQAAGQESGGINARLYAYSPQYSPEATGTGPVWRARKEGGIALSVFDLKVGAGLGLNISVPNAEFSLTPDETSPLPVLRGEFTATRAGVAPLPELSDVKLSFDSGAAGNNPVLRGEGKLGRKIKLGQIFELSPAAGAAFDVGFEVTRRPERPGGFGLRVSVSPARLAFLGLVGAGATALLYRRDDDGRCTSPNRAFDFSTDGPWGACVSLGPFTIQDASQRVLLRVGDTGKNMTAQIDGKGTQEASLTLNAPADATVEAFPGQPHALKLSQAAPAQKVVVKIDSRGGFSATAAMPPLKFGRFTVKAAGGAQTIPVTFDGGGLKLGRGLQLALADVSDELLTLESFTLDAAGAFNATVAGGTIKIDRQNFFSVRAGSGQLRRTAAGEVSLTLRNFQLTLFPGTAGERRITGGELKLDSTGRFAYEAAFALRLPPLPPGVAEGSQQAPPLLANITGKLKVGMDEGLNPSATLTDARLSSPQLGGSDVSAQVGIGAGEVTAHFRMRLPSIPNLIETEDAPWKMTYKAGADGFELSTPSVKCTILGMTSPAASAPKFYFGPKSLSADFPVSGYTLTLPNVFEVSFVRCGLVVNDFFGTALGLEGSASVLKVSGAWLFHAGVEVEAHGTASADFAGIIKVPEAELLNIPGVLKVVAPDSSLYFARERGSLYLRLAELRVTLLGNEFRLERRPPKPPLQFDAGGFGFDFNIQKDLSVFKLRTGGGVRFSPRQPDRTEIVCKGATLDAQLDGWATINLPDFRISPAGEFEVALPTLNFHGMSFGAEGKLRYSLASGATVKVSDRVGVLGVWLNREMTIDPNGNVTGSISGSFKPRIQFSADFDPPSIDFGRVGLVKVGIIDPGSFSVDFNQEVDFGHIHMSYSHATRQFQTEMETRAGARYEYAVDIAGRREVLHTIDMSVTVRFRLTFSGSGMDLVRI